MENVFWLFVAILIISFLSYFYLFIITFDEIRDTLSVVYSSVVCSKDEDNNYFLSYKTDSEFCKNLDKLDGFLEINCMVFYKDQEGINSCEKTKQIIYKRKGDCIDFIFNDIMNTSVKNYEIDEICKKLKN